VGEVKLPRLLFWESPSDAGSFFCLNEALGSRLIMSNTQCPGSTSESQTQSEWQSVFPFLGKYMLPNRFPLCRPPIHCTWRICLC